jgi:hypothetical protein
MEIQYVIPVGIGNFRELITDADPDGKKNLFVDKTYFIKEILRDRAKVLLITRPRRFGKTINMSMLQHFLAAEVDMQPTKNLFNNLLISKDPAAMAYQGKYPVIFVTFKDAKGDSYAAIEAAIRAQICFIYEEFKYLLDSKNLMSHQKNIFQQILDKTSNLSDLINSIKNLSQYIYLAGGVRPYLLLDEYDTPIHSAYCKDYYKEVLNLIRGMLSTALKDNSNIEKGILSGITRIARESLFSELNNLTVYTLQKKGYADCFGFTETEVMHLCSKMQLDASLAEIKAWYNGYLCRDITLYNPWSVMHCLKNNGEISSYWINTSSNDLVTNLMIRGGVEIYEKLEILLQGQTVLENLDDHVVYQNINENRASIWTLLVMTGYLKVVSYPAVEGSNKYELALPNKEVRYFYQNAIQIWLSDRNGAMWYQNFLEDLLVGKLLNFEKKLLQIVQATFSVRDIEENQPEKFYHAFMLGLLATLQQTHIIESNRESGLGYYDFLIIPKDRTQNGVILEFKAPKSSSKVNLVDEAKLALQQIKQLKYAMRLEHVGIKKIISIGIAFAKKDVKICFEKNF